MDHLFDHPLIAQRYFFPRGAAPADAFVIHGAHGHALQCHLSGTGSRLLVYFHGNGECVGDYLPSWPETMSALMGVRVLLAAYRGYGGSEGRPAMAAMLDDVEAIHRAHGVEAGETIVFGRSVGSIYAVEYAARHPDLGGLILESAIADPLERVLLRVRPGELGVDHEAMARAAAERFDHRAKLEAFAGPALVMHTLHDELVSVDHGERLASWIGESAELLVFERGGHNTIFGANQAAYLEALRQFGAVTSR